MNIIDTIAANLGIQRLRSETDLNYTSRIILSSLSKWMLTSIFSAESEKSVESVRSIATEKLSLFQDVMSLSTVSMLDTKEFEDISDYIYKTLLENGAFFHKAFYVIPRERQLISLGQASIIHGMQPEERCVFSGLAPILIGNNDPDDLPAIFDLPDQPMDEIVALVWKRSVTVDSTVVIGEYLKFDNLRRGYYDASRYDNQPITMGRTMHAGAGYEHYIIKGNSIRRIPDNLVSGGYREYCRLAIINSAAQQAVYAEADPYAVKLKFDYKLPANDLRFIRFVGWPPSLSPLNSPFEFVVHSKVWPAIKSRLEYLNYKVVQA